MDKYIVRITFKDSSVAYPITRRTGKELTTHMNSSYVFTKAQTKAIIDDINYNIKMGEDCLNLPILYSSANSYLKSTIDNVIVDKKDIEKIEIVKVKITIEIDE